jgi:hypothetical protein
MPLSRSTRPLIAGATLLLAFGCQTLGRFETKGKAAYCGEIVDSKFVWTPDNQGGFDRQFALRLRIDATELTTNPGTLSSNDADGGPCGGAATFDEAKLVVTPELSNDPLSTLTFEDGQVQNVVAWVDSTCRGKMLAIVSLYKSNHVQVRLLKPGANTTNDRDAFALFMLDRYDDGCPSNLHL